MLGWASPHTSRTILKIQINYSHSSSNSLRGVTFVRGLINVAVKFSSTYSPSEHSLLVNTHFDTVPSSQGVSDSGAMVSVLLETIRKLSQLNATLTHNVIFLFNGYIESGFLGSQLFVTKHKWRNEVRYVSF